MKIWKKYIRLLIAVGMVLLLLPLVACCSNGAFAKSDAYEEDYMEAAAEVADTGLSGKMMRSPAGKMAPKLSMQKDSAAEVVNSSSPSGGELPVQERKRIYNASAGIVLDNPEKTRLEYEKMAVDAGGYVENSYTDRVVLRVPASRFDEVLKAVLASGRVEFSRVETYDVTEAYADVERRLKTARETRKRLYVLLEKSTKPAERARILREIGRLTEEIESLKQQVALMDSRVSFSSISIQLIPRIGGELTRSAIPFGWMAALDPTVPAGWKLKARVRLELDDDWALFSKEDVFMAENSHRGHVLISTVENSPQGDSLFWQNALEHHLGPFYASLEKKTLSAWDVHGVELVSKDQYPFRYFVGVKADGKNLHVVEIFSPDAESGFDEIYAAFEKGGIQ